MQVACLPKLVPALGDSYVIKSLAQEHNTTQYPRPGLESRPLDLKTSALTMRPPNLVPRVSLLFLPWSLQ